MDVQTINAVSLNIISLCLRNAMEEQSTTWPFGVTEEPFHLNTGTNRLQMGPNDLRSHGRPCSRLSALKSSVKKKTDSDGGWWLTGALYQEGKQDKEINGRCTNSVISAPGFCHLSRDATILTSQCAYRYRWCTIKILCPRPTTYYHPQAICPIHSISRHVRLLAQEKVRQMETNGNRHTYKQTQTHRQTKLPESCLRKSHCKFFHSYIIKSLHETLSNTAIAIRSQLTITVSGATGKKEAFQS